MTRSKFGAILGGLVLSMAILLGLATPANATVYFGCPSGTGCVWIDKDGGSSMYIIRTSDWSLSNCHLLPPGFQHEVSSASADYTGGWNLMLYQFSDCTAGSGLNHFFVQSSHFYNFTGGNSYFNDTAVAFRICQYPCIFAS